MAERKESMTETRTKNLALTRQLIVGVWVPVNGHPNETPLTLCPLSGSSLFCSENVAQTFQFAQVLTRSRWREPEQTGKFALHLHRRWCNTVS
jgi:hypothetical protein